MTLDDHAAGSCRARPEPEAPGTDLSRYRGRPVAGRARLRLLDRAGPRSRARLRDPRAARPAGIRPARLAYRLHELSLRHSGAGRPPRPRHLQRRRPDLPCRPRPALRPRHGSARLPRDFPRGHLGDADRLRRHGAGMEPWRGPADGQGHADPAGGLDAGALGRARTRLECSRSGVRRRTVGSAPLHDPAPAALAAVPRAVLVPPASPRRALARAGAGGRRGGLSHLHAHATERAASPRRWRVTADRGRPGAARPRQWTRR